MSEAIATQRATGPSAPDGADARGRLGPPALSRLARVELRKSRDTRAGVWLLALTAALVVAAQLLVLFAGDVGDRTFSGYAGISVLVVSVLLPVVGILLVTSEWSQRTGLATFALSPIRSRIIAAKLAAALALAGSALVLIVLSAAISTAVRHDSGAWDLGFAGLVEYAVLLVLSMLSGVGFGMLLLNSPAAIVLSFVIPSASAVLFNTWTALRPARDWVDLSSATGPLGSHDASAADWAQVGVASLLWIAVPVAIGAWRILRAEIK